MPAFVGDPGAAATMTLMVLNADDTVTDLLDGGALPLRFPPQGGRVGFVGVRANNVVPCGVQLSGVLRDPTTQQVRLDARTVNLRVLDGGTEAQSLATSISTWANIPLCPNQWASRDVFGNTFELEVSLTDRGGRTVSRSMNVVPYCAEPDRLEGCQCICREGYVLGETCMTDGGILDGGSPDGAAVDGGNRDGGTP